MAVETQPTLVREAIEVLESLKELRDIVDAPVVLHRARIVAAASRGIVEEQEYLWNIYTQMNEIELDLVEEYLKE